MSLIHDVDAESVYPIGGSSSLQPGVIVLGSRGLDCIHFLCQLKKLKGGQRSQALQAAVEKSGAQHTKADGINS